MYFTDAREGGGGGGGACVCARARVCLSVCLLCSATRANRREKKKQNKTINGHCD